jgi:hypothetical protein
MHACKIRVRSATKALVSHHNFLTIIVKEGLKAPRIVTVCLQHYKKV